MNNPSKTQIVALLDKWIRQRPGLEFANYGDISSYRSELRSITKQGTIAKALLRYVETYDSITAEMLMAAFKNAFSGRLSLSQREDGKWVLDYCTGQYWPTEYRRAACAVLSSAIWYWWREHCMPSEEELQKRKQTPGDYLRACAVRQFGRGIARAYFD